MNRISLVLVIFVIAFLSGCGGSSYSQPSPQPVPSPPPGPTDVKSMQGSWEIQFHSDVSPNDHIVLEANLSQAGTHVFAGATSALLYQGQSANPFSVGLNRFGGKCDGGGNDEVIFDGTLTNQQPTTEALAFTLTENGAVGSSVINASATTNGLNIPAGTYSMAAACGFPEDHGTLQGFQDSLKFSGADSYHGTFNSGTDSILVRFASDPSGFGLTATGTDNGAPFVLSGSTVGFSLTLTGTVFGNAVTWFGLYDSTYNTFKFYDQSAKFLGSLSGSPLGP
jgi:hypothetical protein